MDLSVSLELIDGITRLEKAFFELRYEHDIFAEQNWTWCLTDGHAEAFDIIKDDPAWSGWCFYHWQGACGLIETGYTHLYYGSWKKSHCGLVARTVCDVLEDWSFDVEWNGKTEEAIWLKVFNECKEVSDDE